MDLGSDIYTFGGLAIVLFIWFAFIVNSLQPFILENPFIAYFIFVIGYSILMLKFIFKKDIIKDINFTVAFLMIMFVFTIITSFTIIPLNGAPEFNNLDMLRSDYILYSAFSGQFPHEVCWLITYVIGPVAVLYTAYLLTGKRKLKQMLKEAV